MKTKRVINSILFVVALFGCTNVSAQTVHPVTASLQLVPPYSVYLADYAAPGNDKLRVILTLNDLTQPSYTVRLRFKVELNGRAIMQTDPAYRPSGITIMPGMPQIITGAQLSDYLLSDHLQFLNGFSRDNYERTKALPEGAYRICVTAYDYNRSDEVAISNEGCNIFFFQKKEAPLLNYPLCNSRVDRKDPQFLTFTWSIRNTPSFVTGSSGTGYRFELFEVRPSGSNPEYIVRSSTPVYSTTTDAAMLVYGPGAPRLIDSMQYVWRVQAFDKDGRDAYQNNGYSLACVFTYGGVDPFVVNNIGKAQLFGEALGERSGKWWWHIGAQQKIDGWNLQYRKQTAGGNKNEAFDWNTKYISDTLFHLFNLEPDNTYEAKVQPVVKGINGFWSETVVFRTMPKRIYECGKNDTANYGLGAATPGLPLNSAVAGMVVRVGDFDMQLLEVSGGNGRFSGYGAIATPLLGMRLNVKFTDVLINDRLQVTQGEVVAITDGIDAWIKDRTKVKKDVEIIKDWTETIPDFETASLPELKDFATELLGISEGVWNDTYVFTESERKDVQAALAEVKAAMQELEDNDPSNDAAAEKKLRQSLKKAEPLVKKLSDHIGKGVLVKLGLVKDKLISDALTDVKREVEAALQKLVFEDNEARRSLLAMHGPHVFGYKEPDGDKENLEAKKKLIEELLANQEARQLFAEKIERNAEDNNYVNQQEKVLESLFEKEENKTKNSKELLKADSWGKVITIINKYLDAQIAAKQLVQGSRFMSAVQHSSSFTKPDTKEYYLAPDGKPLNLQNWYGVISIPSYDNASKKYVIVGLAAVIQGKYYRWDAKEKDGYFIGYVNTKDETDVLDFRIKDKLACNALLPFALDKCSYKTIVVHKWKVPQNKTIDEVESLLQAEADPAAKADKSQAKSFMSLTMSGVTIPTCRMENDAADSNGISGSGSQLIVMASSVPNQEELKKKLGSIGFKIDASGGFYFDRIILTDDNITDAQKKALVDLVANEIGKNKNYRILWIQCDKSGKFKEVETHYSADVSAEVRAILDAFRDYIQYVGGREEWQKFLDHISNALKQLADFIRKIQVPEKYYNPAHADYDTESFVLFLFKQASVGMSVGNGLHSMFWVAPGIAGKIGQKVGDKNNEVGFPEINFAFYCGVWNGLVDQIASLPEGASWLIDMITNKEKAREKFIGEMQKLHKEAERVGGFCNLLGQVIDKSFNGPNAALNAHSYGVATSQAITFFLAIAKVGQATKVMNVLNKLDAVGALVNLAMSPVIKVLGWSTRVVLTGTGKVAIRIVKDGTDILVAFLKAKSTYSTGGKVYSILIPGANNLLAATEEFLGKVKSIKVKRRLTGEGEKVLMDEEGRIAVELEYIDEAGNAGTMHGFAEEAKDITELAKKLNFDEKVTKNIDEAVDAAEKHKFYAECDVNAELKEFVESVSEELKDVSAKKGRKLTWPEILQLYKRGNDFNRKAVREQWYPYNEVTVEVKGKKYRVDAYDPENKLIISRKATTLADIKFETFDNYLNELKAKYAPGSKITAPKYEHDRNYEKYFKNKTLQGTLVLEIPDSNKSFSGINEYINHAKSKGIEISFKPE